MINYEQAGNIADIITQQSLTQPNAVAIDMMDTFISYGQLENIVWKVSTFLVQNGTKSGSVVSMMIEDEMVFIVTLLAIARIGATVFVIPGNMPTLMKKNLLNKVKTDLFITDLFINKFQNIISIILDRKTLKILPEDIDFGVRAENPKAPYIIISGSGSTGKSKLMPITHEQELQKVKLSLQWMPNSLNNRLASLSQVHFYSTIIMYLRAFNFGATVVLFKKEINPILACKKYNITILFASIFHIHQIFKSVYDTSENILNSLDMLYVTGSFVSSSVKNKILKVLTKNLYIAYGTNESSTATLLKVHTDDKYRDGLVGHPIMGVHIQIVDLNDDLLAVDTIGIIRIKSPATINGYLEDDKSNMEAFRDGWFYPGDLGKFTEDGQLIYMGRTDDMMIMNGINIYPAEIEQVITTHPDVKDATAIPIKSSINQDIPVCAVVLCETSEVKEQELIHYVYQHLGSRRPRRIIILDNIPRNEQGKLIRKELASDIVMNLTPFKEKS